MKTVKSDKGKAARVLAEKKRGRVVGKERAKRSQSPDVFYDKATRRPDVNAIMEKLAKL